jgi:hypothetical protein
MGHLGCLMEGARVHWLSILNSFDGCVFCFSLMFIIFEEQCEAIQLNAKKWIRNNHKHI